MKYCFYYDESEHSRVINLSTVTGETYYDAFLAAIVVYSSAPEQAVIGEIKVIKTLKMKPTTLWNSTKANAGISRSKYRKYFSGCTTAYAFALGSFKRYETSKSLADFNIQSAPQSFAYLDD